MSAIRLDPKSKVTRLTRADTARRRSNQHSNERKSVIQKDGLSLDDIYYDIRLKRYAIGGRRGQRCCSTPAAGAAR
jgi:hypothetical protein